MTAYLVVRASLSSFGWGCVVERDFHFQPHPTSEGGPVQVPEAVFLDRVEAERECDRRERAARELLNPFWVDSSDLQSLCSASAESVRAQLVDLGLSPPPGADWRAWWSAESPGWRDDQRAFVWDLLDKLRLFEVMEIELE